MSSTRHLPRGTVTFLFTDIEGSTRMVQALGADWAATLDVHSSILRDGIEGCGGVVVGTEGDSFFAVFETSEAAVQSAVSAQRELTANDWPATAPRVRMGLHIGMGTLGGSDYIGLDVHRAARIANAAHGGQIVASEATVLDVEPRLPEGVWVLDLGKHMLRDLLDPETIFQVQAQDLPDEFPPLRTLDVIPNNLPAQVTTFVGREKEIRQAIELLGRVRLLTLTGPGGTGKSRLALQVAAELSHRFEDGVFFVALSPVSDVDVVPSTILNALGLSASTADLSPNERLLDAVAGRNMLMILDNFEHLLTAAPVVSSMLRASPRSQFIVTSRAPLRIFGEQEMPIPPLGEPTRGSVQSALESESVQLLIDRARAVSPDFVVDESNVEYVTELVTRLDGLPLAIELASARLRHFPLETIVQRLDAKMLASGAVDLPERQQTIERMISWSHDLLDPAVKTLFARMGVFAGGGRIEEIEEVCAGGLGVDVLSGVSELVEQSLLTRRSRPSGERFRMLHVIREFALNRLGESGEESVVRLGHLRVYTELAERAASEILGPHRHEWLDALEAEHDNVRTALDWALDHRHVDAALRLSAAMWRFWQGRGHLYEGEARLEEALELAGGDDQLRAKAIEALGGIHWWRGDLESSVRRYDEALAMQREMGDRGEIANALYNYALARAMADGSQSAVADLMDEALVIFREMEDDDGIANVLWGIGNGAIQDDDLDKAEEALHEASSAYRRANNLFGESWALFELAEVDRRRGRIGEAWRHVSGALEIFRRSRDVTGVVMASGQAASIALLAGDRHRAYRLIGAVDALVETSGAELVGIEFNVVDGLERETVAQLDGGERLAYEEGKAMTYEDTLNYALAGPVDATSDDSYETSGGHRG